MKKLKRVFLVATIAVMCAMVSVGFLSPKNTSLAETVNGDGGLYNVNIDNMWIHNKYEDADKVYKLPVQVSYDKMRADLSDDGSLNIDEIFDKVYPDLPNPAYLMKNVYSFRNFFNSLDIINYYYCKFLQEDGSTDILVNNNFLDTLKAMMEFSGFTPQIHARWSFRQFNSISCTRIDIIETLEKYVRSRGFNINSNEILFDRNFVAYKSSIKAGKPLFVEMSGKIKFNNTTYNCNTMYTADTMYNGLFNKKLRFNSSLMEDRYRTELASFGFSILFEYNSINIYSDIFESVDATSVEITK